MIREKLLVIKHFLGVVIVAEYLEIESIEWVENIPDDVEDRFVITSGRGTYVRAGGSNNVMNIINEYSDEGWEVVSFTDTFNRIERNILQRRKCYLLSRS